MKRSWTLAWPYLAGLAVLVAAPAAVAAAFAFTDYSALEAPRFIGGTNFGRLADDSLLRTATANSAILFALAMPLRIGAAAGAAILLSRRSWGSSGGRALVFLPSVLPDAAYALLWLWILNPLYGPVALLLGSLGQGLLTDPWTTRVAIAVMVALQLGEAFVVALAVRRSIPSSLYEAAAVDGASPWFTLRRVTLPLMLPVLVLLGLRELVMAFGTSFTPAFIVTEGGPRYATTFLPLYVYRQAFVYFKFGYAAAMSVALFAFTSAIVYTQYRLARRWKLI